MCESINGPGELDLLTLKLMSESHLILPNLGTLGLWVLELFAMYAINRQTHKSNAYCPFPMGESIISDALLFLYHVP